MPNRHYEMKAIANAISGVYTACYEILGRSPGCDAIRVDLARQGLRLWGEGEEMAKQDDRPWTIGDYLGDHRVSHQYFERIIAGTEAIEHAQR